MSKGFGKESDLLYILDINLLFYESFKTFHYSSISKVGILAQSNSYAEKVLEDDLIAQKSIRQSKWLGLNNFMDLSLSNCMFEAS